MAQLTSELSVTDSVTTRSTNMTSLGAVWPEFLNPISYRPVPEPAFCTQN